MENEHFNQKADIFSKKVKAGKRRTYFFDVRTTKSNDFFLTITESTKSFENDTYERHKIFIYKEDFNRFLAQLQDTIDHVKKDLLPDFDYDQFEKRQAEWEASLEEGGERHKSNDDMNW